MDRQTQSAPPTALLLAAALAAGPALAQTGLLRGTVVDADDEPIAGVRITVTSEELSSYDKSLETNKRGEFRLRFQPNQVQYQFVLLFEKPGYQAFTQPISPSLTQDMRERFVMEAAETRAVESHGELSSVVTGGDNEAIAAFNAGLTAQKAGDLGEAEARFREAGSRDAAFAPAQVGLAQVLVDTGRHEEAIEVAARAIELGASPVEPLRVQQQALRALGRDAEADAVATEMEAAGDAVAAARVLYNEGGEAFQADDRVEALARFQRAAQLDPTLKEAHHAVATLLLADGDFAGAATAAEKALALGSDDVRTLRVLYDAYQALGRSDELLEIAPRLAAVDPEFGGAKLVEQAAELWNGGEGARAVTLAKMALAIDGTLAKAYYFIGLDHASRSENDAAKAALGRFIELAPDDPEVATAQAMLDYIE